MTEQLDVVCPQCERKLRVGEQYIGQQVRCPLCKAVFAAAADLTPFAVTTAPPAPPPEPIPLPAKQREDEEEEPPRRRDRRRPDWEDRDDIRDWRRPNRSSSILTLGVLGLVFFCIPVAGITLGSIALTMANSDLNEIRRGRMDSTGRSQIETGRVCGTIAVVLSAAIIPVAICLRLGRL